jgi:hypothetical protein
MIFFDPSGTRWKKFKTASGGMIALAVLPVAALISGALLLQPSWSAISLAQQTSHIISAITSVAQSVTAPVPKPAATSKPTPISAHTNSPKASKSSSVLGVSSSPSPIASSTPSSTSTPVASPSPVASASPGNSPYGQSHHPTK